MCHSDNYRHTNLTSRYQSTQQPTLRYDDRIYRATSAPLRSTGGQTVVGLFSPISSLLKDSEDFDLISGGIAKPLFFLSMPIVVTNLLQTAYNLADTFWLSQYSTDALAGISFAFPMVFLLISLGMRISVAGSVLVAAPIADVFTTDPEVVNITAQFLRYVALTSVIGIMRAYTGSFRGAEKILTAAAISVLMLGIIQFPIAWIASEPLGERGIWLSFAVSNVVGALIAYVWHRRGTWRESNLTESRVDLDEASVEPAGND